MIDITTGTGDFIANGVISHNCFARNTHTYLDLDAGKDFDSQIIVKVNVAEVLEQRAGEAGWGHHPVALGTNTDPYQRAEGRYRLMPGIISALAASGTPFSILTKGSLLRRDLPLLQEAAEHVPVDLSMSIAVYDDELQQSVEPGTPSTAARLATVKAAREAGLPCAVFLMPVLPFLTDSIAHLDRAFEHDRGCRRHLGRVLRPASAARCARVVPGVDRARASASSSLATPTCTAAARTRRRSTAAGSPRGCSRCCASTASIDRAGSTRRRASCGHAPRPAARAAIRDATSTRSGASLIAAELSPAAAAAIQPTLF